MKEKGYLVSIRDRNSKTKRQRDQKVSVLVHLKGKGNGKIVDFVARFLCDASYTQHVVLSPPSSLTHGSTTY